MRNFLKVWAVLALAGLGSTAGAQDAGDVGVFTPIPGAEGRDVAAGQPFAKRARLVEIDTGSLFGEAAERGAVVADRVTLNLLDGVVVEAFREDRDLAMGATPVWYASLPEEVGGYALMVMTGDGYVSGKVHSPALGLYEIAAVAAGGVASVIELNADAMPGCGNTDAQTIVGPNGPDARPHDVMADHDCGNPDCAGRAHGGWTPPAISIEGERAAAERGGATVFVDVLLAFTPQARGNAGGTAQITSIINSAVADANLGYQNSDVDIRIRAAAIVETNYTEDSADMGNDLSRLRSTNDGNMDELHALRNTVGADIVALVVANAAGNACGIGYLMTNVGPGFASDAFNVTSRTCFSNLTLHHELGHNMGLAHDRDNSGGASWPYAYGYRTPDNVYRTVMAYAPGTRINYFSNPDISFNGRVLGNPVNHPTNAAFNALALNNNALQISIWRTRFTTVPGVFSLLSPIGGTVADRTPTLDWSDSAEAEFYEVQIDDNADFSSPLLTEQLQQLTTQFTVPQRVLAPGGSYHWRVTSTNPLGQRTPAPVSASFAVPLNPPGAFTLTSPAQNAVGVDRTPIFTWSRSIDNDSYTLVIDDNADFSSPRLTIPGITGESYGLSAQLNQSLLSLTTYYWKVTATNTVGAALSTPVSRSFTTIGLPPQSFALVSPANGPNVNTLRPTLSWAASNDALSYRVIVDDDQALASPAIDQSGITGTSWQVPAGVLQNQTRYYWTVIASNVSGSTPSTPTTFTFGVIASAPPCQGDGNRDGAVNFADVSAVLANFGGTGPQGDANYDNSVNFADVSAVLASFGASCN